MLSWTISWAKKIWLLNQEYIYDSDIIFAKLLYWMQVHISMKQKLSLSNMYLRALYTDDRWQWWVTTADNRQIHTCRGSWQCIANETWSSFGCLIGNTSQGDKIKHYICIAHRLTFVQDQEFLGLCSCHRHEEKPKHRNMMLRYLCRFLILLI